LTCLSLSLPPSPPVSAVADRGPVPRTATTTTTTTSTSTLRTKAVSCPKIIASLVIYSVRASLAIAAHVYPREGGQREISSVEEKKRKWEKKRETVHTHVYILRHTLRRISCTDTRRAEMRERMRERVGESVKDKEGERESKSASCNDHRRSAAFGPNAPLFQSRSTPRKMPRRSSLLFFVREWSRAACARESERTSCRVSNLVSRLLRADSPRGSYAAAILHGAEP